MRKLILSLIIILFCISFISAEKFGLFGDIKTDNYKEYKQEGKYGKINVWDKGQLSEDKKLSETTLDYNTDFCLINCEARGTTILHYDSELFNDFNIYDLKKNKEELKDYNKQKIYIKNGTIETEVDNYYQVCSINKEGLTECERILNGTKTISENTWKEYNGEKLTAGTYEWKITGKKSEKDNLDWTLNIQGLETTEWASWNATYETNLFGYFDFSSEVNLINDSMNLFVSDGDGIVYGGTGINGDCGDFTSDVMNITGSNVLTTFGGMNVPSTFNVWVNIDTEQQQGLMQKGGGNTATYFNAANMQVSGFYNTGTTMGSGRWVMFSVVNNATGYWIYVNGTYIGGSTTPYATDANDYFSIGDAPGVDVYDGKMDEMAYWTRQLSAVEINDLYNGGTGIFYVPNVLPSITLNNPIPYYNSTSRTITFNWTATDDVQLENSTLYINGVRNYTKEYGEVNYSSDQISLTFNADGVYNWSVITYDNVADLTTSETRFFTINATPSVELNSPVDYYNSTSRTITFNWTASDFNNIENSSLYIDGVLNQTITHGTSNFTSEEVSLTFNADGDYNWTATAYNNEIVEGTTDTRFFSINSTPTITVQSPVDNTNYTYSNIYFNATSNLNIDTWIINYNGTNYTLPSINSSVNVEDGNYTLDFWGRNSDSGVWGLNDSVSFIVDTNAPSIITNSGNGTFDYSYSGANHSINFTVTEGNLDSCWLDYNETNTTISCSSGIQTNYSFVLESGEYDAIIYANDTFGNLGSENVSFDYRIFENSISHNYTTFETKRESYSINVTANNSLTAVSLFYNNTEHTMTQSDGRWYYSRDIPIGVSNFSFNYKFNYATGTIYSRNSSQNVNETLFTIKNASYSQTFLNISFKDENDLSIINASIPTSTFTYYLGTGSVNKTYTFSNNTNNYEYLFTGTTVGQSLKVIPEVQYRQVSDYPQRIWQPTINSYSEDTQNQTLYLLNTNDGIYVTYQVLTTSESPIEGVDVTATRTVSGETIQVGAGSTDSAGTITFWMNPDFQHITTFVKSGYDNYAFTHFPTQNSYTITLGEDIEEEDDCVRGILEKITPTNDFLTRNQTYDFSYNVSTSHWNFTSFAFTLTDEDGTDLGSNSSTTSSGGTLTLGDINVTDKSTITMTYYYEIDATESSTCGQISGTRVWITQSSQGTQYGLWQLFEDTDTYISAGLFGFDDFGKTLIAFLIIVLMVGGLSMRYGIASEGAIMGILFGTVFMLDVGLGFIPGVEIGDIVSIEHFFTFITFIILLAVIIREEMR